MLIKLYIRSLWRDQGLKANKTKDSTDIKNYKKQRNYVANLNKEVKLKYYSKFESNDHKPFWANCKPYFTNKHSKADTDIMLSENGELILKTKEIAIIVNDHFGSILEKLWLGSLGWWFSVTDEKFW